MGKDTNAVMVEFEDWDGDRCTIALYKDSYAMGGGLALSALDATDPTRWDYLSPWGYFTVNIPDNPDAARWCATEGNVIIDTNNNSKELVNALVKAGIIILTDQVCHSGYCTYPFAKVAPWALDAIGTYEETFERLTGDSHDAPQTDVPDRIAVGVGYTFTLVPIAETEGIKLKESGSIVTVDGQDYPLMKGTAFEDSRKVDALLDVHGELKIKDHLRAQEPSSLKCAAEQTRQASEHLAQDMPGTGPARENSR